MRRQLPGWAILIDWCSHNARVSNVTGVAVVNRTVWLVGSFLDEASGDQLTLVARHTSSGWKAVSAPNPGNGDRILGEISAASGTAWAVGAFDGNSGREPLVEVHAR